MQTSSAVRPAAGPSSAPTPCKNIANLSFFLANLFVVVRSAVMSLSTVLHQCYSQTQQSRWRWVSSDSLRACSCLPPQSLTGWFQNKTLLKKYYGFSIYILGPEKHSMQIRSFHIVLLSACVIANT